MRKLMFFRNEKIWHNRNVFKSRTLGKFEMFPSDPFGSLDDFSFKAFIYFGGVSYE